MTNNTTNNTRKDDRVAHNVVINDDSYDTPDVSRVNHDTTVKTLRDGERSDKGLIVHKKTGLGRHDRHSARIEDLDTFLQRFGANLCDAQRCEN